MTVEFVNKGIMPALDEVERQWRAQWGKANETKKKELGKGALIFVGRRDQDKFFSNGMYRSVIECRRNLPSDLDAIQVLISRTLSMTSTSSLVRPISLILVERTH